MSTTTTDTLSVHGVTATTTVPSSGPRDLRVVDPEVTKTGSPQWIRALAAIAILAALLLVASLVIHARMAAPLDPAITVSSSVAAPVDRSEVVHGTEGDLVDGVGRRIVTEVPSAADSGPSGLPYGSKIAQISRLGAQ